MKKLLFLILCIPLLTNAQSGIGINFVKDLSWEQIKEKAKTENKYIFLDCFATWCGPCKRMDKEVYINDTVARYFNDKFVSVKVQMDKSEKDDASIRRWYEDAELLKKQYRITAYPFFVFLDPEGTIVHKEIGFKRPTELLEVAHTAILPGKKYDNPYSVYDSLLTEYNHGTKNYSTMLYMIKTATELGETDIRKALKNDYNNYLFNLDEKRLYTRENIEYIASVVNSKSRFLALFFPNGTKVDQVMNKKGYAESVIDQIILFETITPFLQTKKKGMPKSPAKIEGIPQSDWQQLYNIIKNKYTEKYATRNLLEAQIIWNEQQRNYDSLAKYFIIKYEKYGVDTTDLNVNIRLNEVAWIIFLYCTNKDRIKPAIKWMEGVVRRSHNWHPLWKAGMTDTYASLLYKLGKKLDAIRWEEKALDIAVNDLLDQEVITDFQDRLNQMKKGKQTWIAE